MLAGMPPAKPAPSEDLLTPRQLEVLELVAKGLPNKEIAGVLGIAPATVKHHVAAVIEALDVTNRTEAVSRLHELGLGSAPEEGGAFKVDGFGSRPAIAVLPFDDFSDEKENEHLADGFAEDLITRLAGWRWFPVISRNSTFVYKGKTVDVREVSRALGARYVIEGSVRRMGERIRITVQLIDGGRGEHVWAQRYDGELAQIFELSDEIVDGVVATLEPAIARIEGLRVVSQRPEQLDAWDLSQRAWLHKIEQTIPGLVAAQECVDRSLELDPDLAIAISLGGLLQFHFLLLGREGSEARIEHAARRLMEVDRTDPFAHLISSLHHFARRDGEPALAAAERAVELGPSLVWARMMRGMALLILGRPADTLASLEQALRLSPQDALLSELHLVWASAFLQLGRFDEAIGELRSALREAPELPYAYPWLAFWHASQGEADEAASLTARMRELDPNYDPTRTQHFFVPPEAESRGDVLLLAPTRPT